MTKWILALALFTPAHYSQKPLTKREVRSQAHQIVYHLKKQDPRVLRSVMYYMGWVPKIDYKRERRKRQKEINAFDQWHLDFLMNEAGIPQPRKKRK